MEPRAMGTIIKVALIAGVLASILTAGFHYFATEPVMDRAIELESPMSRAEGGGGYEPLVSRDAQRAGLFLGFLMFGLTWALLFSVIYHLAQRYLPDMRAPSRSLLLGLLVGWSVSIFPFLKYPANPPGVGDPATIQYRQTLYLALIVLSAVNALLTLALHRHWSGQGPNRRSRASRLAIALAAHLPVAALIYFVLPFNQDPIRIPADVVWTFRALSLTGLAIFWLLLSVSFALLIRASGPVKTRLRTPLAWRQTLWQRPR